MTRTIPILSGLAIAAVLAAGAVPFAAGQSVTLKRGHIATDRAGGSSSSAAKRKRESGARRSKSGKGARKRVNRWNFTNGWPAK